MPPQPSSGLIIPDFNQMAQCQQDLHELLVDMVLSNGYVDYSRLSASGHVYDDPTSQFKFVLHQSSIAGTSGRGTSSVIFVRAQGQRDDVLNSTRDLLTDTSALFYQRSAVRGIEGALKTYLSQAAQVKVFGQTPRTAGPAFQALADNHEILHDLLCDMIHANAQNFISSPVHDESIYNSAASGLNFNLNVIQSKPLQGILYEEGIQVVNPASQSSSVFYSRCVEPDIYGFGYEAGVWPAIETELKVALPAIKTARAIARCFP